MEKELSLTNVIYVSMYVSHIHAVVYMCLRICGACVYVLCVCVCIDLRLMLSFFLDLSLPYILKHDFVLKQGLSLSSDLTVLTTLVASLLCGFGF